MTERARQVYALLRTLLAWAPPPRSRTGLEDSPRGFVAGNKRYISCPDCLANDKPAGMVGCETCGGRGEIPDPGPDPYENKRVTRYGFADRDRDKDLARRRDDLIRRLEQDEQIRKGKEAPLDPLTRAVELRDRLARHGSYRELDAALERLRLEHEGAYRVALSVAYSPFGEEPIEPVRRVVLSACELLAEWMPERIRVPAGVPVWTRQELEQHANVMRERATWRGRKDPLARARRDDTIRRLAAEGLGVADLADRVGVHRRTIERVLNTREAPGWGASLPDEPMPRAF